MSGFSVQRFKGSIPKVAPRLLKPEYATTAVDCFLSSDDLKPVRQPLPTGYTFTEQPGRIYPYYDPDTGDFINWIWFPHWTNAYFNVIPNDTYNRIYFLDADGHPQITDFDNVDLDAVDGSGHHIPSVTTSWNLGVPQPAGPPSASNQGGGTDAVIEDRAYIYTYVDAWGSEGPPSLASPIIKDVKIDDTVRVSGFDTPPAGYNWTGGKIRIYRAITGTTESLFLYVGEIDITTSTYDDSKDPSELGEECPTYTWYPPPDVLQGWCLAPNGTLVGFYDNTLYFSTPYLPSAWPPDYQVTVEMDIVGVAPISQSVAVITTKNPYTISGVIPNNTQVRKLDLEEPGINQKAITSIGNKAYYATPNGIGVVTAGEAALVSSPSLTRTQWNNLNPVEAHSFSYDDDYILIYDAQGMMFTDIHGTEDPVAPPEGLMLMDHDDGYYHYWNCSSGVPAIRYHDERLFISCDNLPNWELSEINPLEIDGGIPGTYYWWSKDFEYERPLNFAVGQVMADEYPINLELFADGHRILNTVIESEEPFRLPGGFKARIWSFKIKGTPLVRKVSIYESVKEISDARHSAGEEQQAANS